MRNYRATSVVIIIGIMAVLGGCGDDPRGGSPYADSAYQTRTIKTLDPAKVDDLLQGRGSGYALAAELNQHPGPKHVLELKKELGLTTEQEAAVQRLYEEMLAAARTKGAQLVDLERQLNEGFAKGTMNADELRKLVASVSAVEGELRYVHLETHLRTVPLLDVQQRDKYEKLRGYRSDHGGHQGHHAKKTEPHRHTH